ncbi:hypothetical protein EON65_57725 [archaeon]|nr:MAG: hypothetical protein EON65_57725 [archaeon]
MKAIGRKYNKITKKDYPTTRARSLHLPDDISVENKANCLASGVPSQSHISRYPCSQRCNKQSQLRMAKASNDRISCQVTAKFAPISNQAVRKGHTEFPIILSLLLCALPISCIARFISSPRAP